MDTEQALKRHYHLGSFAVIPNKNMIYDDLQHEQVVAPEVMAILLALIRRYPDTVSRKHLIATVFNDHAEADSFLSSVMANLRGHFNDSIANPQYIETIGKKGYRIIAPLTIDPIDESPTKEPLLVFPRKHILAILAILALGVLTWV